MSFARAALRITAFNAVSAGTYAKVYDSQLAPIGEFVAGEAFPVISVYTDDSKAILVSSEMLTQDVQNLVFELAITQKTKLPIFDTETGEVVDNQEHWVTPQTDAHIELTLDLLCRDIDLALLNTDNPWADLFRDMCSEFQKRDSLRGAAGAKEDRFAGRQVVYEVKLCREPGLVINEGSVWDRFLKLMDLESGYEKIAGLMRASLTGDELSDDLKKMRRSYGLTNQDSTGLLMEEFGEE